ncbi:MAG: sulfite exporter TauE/SafE family protein [SAR324 cluster bacterium]|nr:sulfite exporter TauE/SafE family protein [SAR324 cluster bacterium]
MLETLLAAWPLLLLLSGIFFLAGAIKGTLGIGLPTASVTLMTIFLEPKLALGLVVLPIMIANLQQFLFAPGWKAVLWRYWRIVFSLPTALFITTLFTTQLDSEQIRLVIGLSICTFCITSFSMPNLNIPQRWDHSAQFLAGILSGILGGLTSIWSPPMLAYLISKRVEKEEFILATGILLFTGCLPLALGFTLNGLLTPEVALQSLLMVFPAVFGFWVGAKGRRFLSGPRFRNVVLAAFFIAGVRMIAVAVTS